MARHRPHRLDEPTGAELDRLRKAYLDRSITVLELQRRFRLSDYRIMALAVREGWPLRRTVRALLPGESFVEVEGGYRWK